MPVPLLLFVAAAVTLPPCRVSQLHLSVDDRGGDFNGMSHAGTELSIRNTGQDCSLAALPTVQFRDRRGRVLAATRQAPIGMHPGPVVLPVRIAAGHRATTDLRWVSGPVFTNNRQLGAASISVRIGSGTIRAPLKATLFGDAAKGVTFEQPPLTAAEGMAAG
jgi:hypothetical protein